MTKPNDSLKNIGIEASAGCGKTYQLVSDLCDRLESGSFDISSCVVITFTRKAADELRTRIAFELQNRIEKNESSEVLEKQIKQLGNAPIGTIHAFCARLLKERPIEARVDPAFAILEEEQDGLAGDIWMNWFEKNLTIYNDFFRSWVFDLEKKLFTPNKDYGNDSSLQGLFKVFLEHRDLEWYQPPKPVNIQDWKKNFVNDLEDLARNIEAPTLIDFTYKYIETLKLLKPDKNEPGLQSFWEKGHILCKFSPGNTGGKSESENKEEWKTICKSNISTLEYILEFPEVQKRHKFLYKATKDFLEYYREEQRKMGYLDFTEIMIRTENLLHDHKDVRSFFQSRYTHFFVDEFQDTDPLQIRILYHLCGADDCQSAEMTIRPGSLYVVGDPKQSIYRFRRADIEMFNEAMERIADGKGGKRDILQKNYRSRQEILDWINDFFKDRIRKPGDANYQADYSNLLANDSKDRKTKADGIIEFVECESGIEDDSKIDLTREKEAKMTALRIAELINKENVKASDILVLFRNKKNMLETSACLEELEIACEIEGGRIYFGREEIGQIVSILKAILHPLDKAVIGAALRGPFFGLDETELLEYFKTYQNESGFRPFDYRKYKADIDYIDPVESALKQINEWHKRSLKEGAARLLNSILNENFLLVSWYYSFRGRRKVLNILKALVLLDSYGNIPFAQACDKFSDAWENDIEMDDMHNLSEKNQMVRMMTIHKSKGMESSIVYLADSTSNNTFKETSVFVDSKGQRLVTLLSSSKTARPLEYAELQEQNLLREEAEAERLRYVATTRAEDRLILNHLINKNKDKSFLYAFYSAKKNAVIKKVDVSNLKKNFHKTVSIPKGKNNPELKDEQSFIESLPEKWKQLAKPVFQKLSPSLAHREMIEESKLHVQSTGIDGGWFENIAGSKADRHKLGTLVHRLLELRPKDPLATALHLIQKEELDLKADNLVKVYQKYLESDVLQRESKSNNVYRELPIKFKSKDGCYYDGSIDLLFEETDGWVLVDYKLGSAEDEEDKFRLQKKHQSQMEIYTEGLEQAGIKVKQAELLVI